MDEELMIDVVSFTDDEGNDFEMELIDEFEHNGENYVVLADLEEEPHEHGEDEECDHEETLYIMKVEKTGEGEDFVPVEDDVLEELVAVVESRLSMDDEE